MIEERSITMAGISIHNETDYALTEAMTQEILEPTDSGALGYYAVLRRVHEPLLASIFWLALGCVLWGPNKGVCGKAGQRIVYISAEISDCVGSL
jgi:hypothetical protein